MSNEKSYGDLFDSSKNKNLNEELEAIFSQGKGVLLLQKNMPDNLLLMMIKNAVQLSKGKPFLIIQSKVD